MNRPLLALVALVLAVVGLGMALGSPGDLSIDDVLYHAQTRGLATGQGLTYDNGFGTYGSKELWITSPWGPHMTPARGRLVPQYPPGVAFVAAPLYGALGASALKLPNLLAGGVLLWLVVLVGRELSGSREVGLAAAALVALGSPLPGEMAAIWPHVCSSAFVLGAFLLTWRAVRAEERRSGLLLAGGAGLLVGLGLLFRLDALFAGPALMLVALLAAPGRPRPLLPTALGVGLVPGLALMTAINAWRFGIAWPFHYSSEAASSGSSFYLIFAPMLILLAAIVALGLAGKKAGRAWTGVAVVVGLGVVAALGHSGVRAGLALTPGGLFETLVDARAPVTTGIETMTVRTETGAPIFFGLYRKAWLQSLPWLPLALVPLLRAQTRRGAWPLFAVPLVLALVFSPSRWHGGMCANMRYLHPAVPLVAVAAAWGGWLLVGDRRGPGRTLLAGGVLLGLASWLATSWPELPAGQEETVLYAAPVLLGAGLLALVLATGRLGATGSVSLATLAVAGACAGWAAGTSWGYDVRQTQAIRDDNWGVSQVISGLLEPDALVFYARLDPLFSLIQRGDVLLAGPGNDDFADLVPLATAHQDAGKPVYFVASVARVNHTARQGWFDGFRVVPIQQVDAWAVVKLLPRDEGR